MINKNIMQLNMLNKEKDKWIFRNYKLDNKEKFKYAIYLIS